MTHVPSDDERRSLYLGLKSKGYDNKTRAHLTWTEPCNVELPVDWRDVDPKMVMYHDLFKLPDLTIIDVGDDEAPRKPCINVPCPPWNDASQEEWDRYNALVAQRMHEWDEQHRDEA